MQIARQKSNKTRASGFRFLRRNYSNRVGTRTGNDSETNANGRRGERQGERGRERSRPYAAQVHLSNEAIPVSRKVRGYAESSPFPPETSMSDEEEDEEAASGRRARDRASCVRATGRLSRFRAKNGSGSAEESGGRGPESADEPTT